MDRIVTNLYPHIVWYFVVLDQATNKQEIRVARCGVCNFDLLHTALHELPEEQRLLLDRHRVGQCLVSISQVSRQPNGDLREGFGRPLSVLEINGSVRLVLLRWIRSRNVLRSMAGFLRVWDLRA